VITPILLPFLTLLFATIGQPAPVAEWSAERIDDRRQILQLDLLGVERVDLGKLSIFSSHANTRLSVYKGSSNFDKHWQENASWHWMWTQNPQDVSVQFLVEAVEPTFPPDESLTIAWEQVRDGERHSWTLGTLALDAQNDHSTHQEPMVQRRALELGPSSFRVALDILDVPQGAFVKWSEYVPEGCTCEVLEHDGSSLRVTNNAQVFLWFEVGSQRTLHPTYRLTCMEGMKASELTFDGTLEFAFGTESKTSHIAGVEWELLAEVPNESMELIQSPDPQSVETPTGRTVGSTTDGRSCRDVRYAVQLLANHRDLSSDELSAHLGSNISHHIFRHEGWHKYMTDDVETYSDAQYLRSEMWTTTAAADAFVTASVEGERISVQEALLLSNQTWTP
tara:strand:+ start:185 stop:1366 length:1182 start_codon:yes stop_codon:yes gene_type:complete